MDASHRKSTQVHARRGQTESQVDASFELAPACESVWPRLKEELAKKKIATQYLSVSPVYCQAILTLQFRTVYLKYFADLATKKYVTSHAKTFYMVSV